TVQVSAQSTKSCAKTCKKVKAQMEEKTAEVKSCQKAEAGKVALVSEVTEVKSVTTKANCNPADCKPANCDPADCKPANCKPANCKPSDSKTANKLPTSDFVSFTLENQKGNCKPKAEKTTKVVSKSL
ncbi:MAG: hypothetical protein AAGK97_18525, partial [Bacteroidota bacterium]